MRRLLVIFIISFCFVPLISNAQRMLVNDTKDDIKLVLSDESEYLLATNQSAVISSNAQLGYLRTMQSSGDSRVIKRNGFILLNNDDTIFVSKLAPTKSFLKNNNSTEIVVDYNNYSVFIPPGETRELVSLVLDSGMSYILVITDFNNGLFGPPKTKEINFRFKDRQMSAEN